MLGAEDMRCERCSQPLVDQLDIAAGLCAEHTLDEMIGTPRRGSTIADSDGDDGA